MSETVTDPREQISHDITVGQYYVDSRTGDRLQLRYIDEYCALLRDADNNNRLEAVTSFKKSVGADRFTLDGHDEIETDHTVSDEYETIDWTEVDAVGNAAADSLTSNGYTTTADIEQATDEELLELSYIGETNLENIKEYVT